MSHEKFASIYAQLYEHCFETAKTSTINDEQFSKYIKTCLQSGIDHIDNHVDQLKGGKGLIVVFRDR